MILRRERAILGGCLAVLVAAAWAYLLYLNAAMANMGPEMYMPGMVMLDIRKWGGMEVVLLFFMWAAMMAAMMVPSAAPMLFAFVNVNRGRQAAGRTLAPVGFFLLGYLVVWTAYSGVAALAQWGLHEAAILSTTMSVVSPGVTGGLLIAAGVFQWTPLKRACLAGCRSPLTFLMSEWREGAMGAVVMGLRHGGYCLGCCWILMAVLFVTGVMNLLWVVVIALFVMAEKILARGEMLGHAAGAGLVLAGVTRMAGWW